MNNELFNSNESVKNELMSGIPFIKVIIKGVEIDAMIDTGAKHNMIESKLSELLQLNTSGEARFNNPALGLTSSKTFKVELGIKGTNVVFTDTCIEMPNAYAYPLLLGIDFLKRCKEFNYSTVNNSFELKL